MSQYEQLKKQSGMNEHPIGVVSERLGLLTHRFEGHVSPLSRKECHRSWHKGFLRQKSASTRRPEYDRGGAGVSRGNSGNDFDRHIQSLQYRQFLAGASEDKGIPPL